MRNFATVSWTHALGILRGAAEGNDTRYTHTLGFEGHVAPLIAARLVVRLADDELPELDCFVRPTPDGQAFYDRYLTGLAPHTVCRANMWSSLPEMRDPLAAIEAECRSRISAL
ncbi:hypothetical protein AB0393_27930 [Streptomyces cyaneofuscatus]|uniref:hypothetical protein n=1 Tax=Streptomyces cyaneofuscatus TaxID=66883 RepID=UPI00344D94B4